MGATIAREDSILPDTAAPQPRPLAMTVSEPGTLAQVKLHIFLAARRIVYWLQDLLGKQKANVYLMGNFAPATAEILEQDLKVSSGRVPEGLSGAYCRTGPNPALFPARGYHW